MAQEIINVGATADDGTGDDLRVGFIKTNTNFDQIWAAGPVGSNITVLNNTISVTNTNGNLILSPNGIGIIQTNRPLYPRLDNTYDLGVANLRYRSLFVGAGGITNNGNLTLDNINKLKIPGGNNGYVIQTDGNSVLSWVAMPGAGNGSPGGANGQVQFNSNGLFGGSGNFTFTASNGLMSVSSVNTSEIYANSIAINNNGTPFWSMDGNTLTSPSGGYWVGNSVTLDDYISSAVNGYLNLQTYDASSNLATELHMEHGLVHINISNGEFRQWEFNEDGSLTTAGNIIAPGNIAANYFLGDGSQLINLPGGVIQGNIPPTSPNDTTLWWDDVTGRLYVWYDDGSGLQWVDAAPAGPAVTYGNSNVSSFLASGNNSANIVTTGNISGNYFVGNGSLLTGIATSYGNADVAANLAAFGSNPISTTGSITGGNLSAVNLAINNITSDDSSFVNINDGVNVNGEILATGNITGDHLFAPGGVFTTDLQSGNIQASGNVSGNYFIGNGSQLTGLPSPTVTQDISSTGAMSLMTYDGTIKYVSYATVEPASGNLTVGNISTTGNIAANNFIGLLGNITNLDSLNFAVENISALVGNNGVNIGAGGNNNLVVLPTDVLIQNVPLTVAGNILSTVAGGLNITANTVANGTAQIWNFGTDGDLTLPNAGNVAVGGTAQVGSTQTIATNDGGGLTGWSSQALAIAYDPNVISTYPVGSTITWQDGTTATITQWDDYGPTYIDLFWDTPKTGTLFPITLQTSDYAPAVPLKQWTFGLNGDLTLPGGSRLRPLGANLDIFAGTGSYVNLITSDESSYMGVGGTGGYVVTAGGTWDFNANGNLTAPGDISVAGNIVASNLLITTSASIANLTYNNITNLTTANLVLGLGNTQTGSSVNGGGMVVGNTAEASFTYNFTDSSWDSNIDIHTTGNLLADGNVRGQDLIANDSITATGNIVGGNIGTAGYVATTNLDVSGNTSISNVTINSYTSVPQLWFKGRISSPQNVITSTDTVTLWNNNTDPQSWGNVTTGHIVPNKAGWYEITSRVQFDTNNVANSQQQINHQIRVNDNQVAISQLPNLTGNVPVSMISTAMVEINGSTDYITTTSWSGIAGNAQQINGGNASLLIVRWVST